MYLVVAGTNRPQSNSLRVANVVREQLTTAGNEVELLDLGQLPAEAFAPEAYQTKPAAFAPFQDAVDRCQGIITVVPEYNGSFPGALKYWIDLLRFPGTFQDLPAAFVGIAAGTWGGLRAVEQLQMVYQYRQARLFPLRVFLPQVHTVLDDEGALNDPAVADRLQVMLTGFTAFAERVPREPHA